jgi:two-component system chemotaxis response regulator CheB
LTKVSVLVVDDSVVIRRLVTSVLSEDPDIEVVGTASSGRLALGKIEQLHPDIVTLDVEMPDMNGLEALAELRKKYPRLPVIMFSTVTERGAAATLDALTLGANDYVTKPSAVGSVNEAMESVRHQLVPKIKALAERSAAIARGEVPPLRESRGRRPVAARADVAVAKPTRRPTPAIPAPPRRTTPAGRVDVVAIGLSTGGPDALAQVLPQLPGDLPVPILIVQHMPAVFTRLFAQRLSAKSRVAVVEATPGELVLPGQVYIAPGDYHMTVVRDGADVRIATNQAPPESWCRPAVNVLFRSVADVYGGSTLAVVLTGMGQDGLRGCERLRECNAQIVAQDEPTSVVWGMPGIVATTGLADKVLPLEDIAAEIVQRVSAGRRGIQPAPASTGVR